jgi:hypothetical protein
MGLACVRFKLTVGDFSDKVYASIFDATEAAGIVDFRLSRFD